LFHLVSPALPLGAYAYSQGLEYAVEAGWVHDEPSAASWLHGLLGHGVGTLDLPVVLRLHAAWSKPDLDAVKCWNAFLLAARETAELRAEDLHIGRSLAKVLIEQKIAAAHEWKESPACFAALFCLAATHWSIGPADTAAGYLWTWSENQVLAAVKLIPLGQSAGQRLLHALLAEMPEVVERAQGLTDDEIGTSAVGQSLASAWHETQYSRLFRS
jgi:urease accessory protein